MTTPDVKEQALTPTEDLFMEVLAGRYRCGENTWTFEARHSRVAEVLSRRGLIWWKSGVIERTILAGLTDAGRAVVLSATYTPPALGQATDETGPTMETEAAHGALCDDDDLMCPNCVTPWKCNGPHILDEPTGQVRG
jgi:hypothetical protein